MNTEIKELIRKNISIGEDQLNLFLKKLKNYKILEENRKDGG